jgi:hypothetical protein
MVMRNPPLVPAGDSADQSDSIGDESRTAKLMMKTSTGVDHLSFMTQTGMVSPKTITR